MSTMSTMSTITPTTPTTPTTLTTAAATAAPGGAPSSTAAAFDMDSERLDALCAELDAIRRDLVASLGQEDVDYLRRVIRAQRGLEVAGRGLLYFGWLPPVWLAATAALGLSKILDNMEIGHNVMHGQYDWTGDPVLSSTTFDWDTACPADQWRHSHNYLHHTFTNIVGKDRDVGYGILRMSESTPWSPANLANPVNAAALALAFDLGVMLHDVEFENLLAGRRTWSDAWPVLRSGLRKSGRLALKDYVLFPLLTGPLFVSTLGANLAANVIRNLWAFTIIFCGHFPDGTYQFTEEECEDESKGHWYLRQLLGSANIEGGPLFHLLSGNLSHQIEHHLYPDLPARRYKEIAPQVRAVCERHGLPYNTGSLSRQFGSVVRRIVRLALPDRRRQSGPAPADPSTGSDADTAGATSTCGPPAPTRSAA